MNYYYFIENKQDVFIREEEVDTEMYPQFIPLTSQQVEYYLEHPTAKRYEIEHAFDPQPPAPTPEQLLQEAKSIKLDEIREYDSSDNVNQFFINDAGMWIYPDERSNYMLTLQGAQRLGVPSVPFLGHDIPVENCIMMLDAINLYAMQCVGVTDYHKANVNALTTIADVEAYDYTVGYPQKLVFTVNVE